MLSNLHTQLDYVTLSLLLLLTIMFSFKLEISTICVSQQTNSKFWQHTIMSFSHGQLNEHFWTNCDPDVIFTIISLICHGTKRENITKKRTCRYSHIGTRKNIYYELASKPKNYSDEIEIILHIFLIQIQ